jgi:integrase
MRQERVLYWYKARKCWRKTKRIDGKQRTWYFQHPKNDAGYQAALAEWEAIEAEGKNAEELKMARVQAHEDIRLLDRTIEFHQLEGDADYEKAATAYKQNLVADYLEQVEKNGAIRGSWAEVWDLQRRIETIIGLALMGKLDDPRVRSGEVEIDYDRVDTFMLADAVEEAARRIVKLVTSPFLLSSQSLPVLAVEKHKEWSGQGETHTDKQLSTIQGDFVEMKKTTAISPKTLNASASELAHFIQWLKDRHITSIEKVSGKWLTQYREALLNLADNKEITRVTARKRLVTARTFLRWAYQNDYTDILPRNIDSKALTISINDYVPKYFTVDEVKMLLETAREIGEIKELFILLGLNCGMLPKDISDIHPNEVDWMKGTITRKRSKTGKKAAANKNSKVPTVTYTLWRRTFELLKKCRCGDDDHVFLTSNGLPLCRAELKGGGTRVTETNNVVLHFRYVVSRLPKKLPKGKTFKTLRATGASKLEEHPTHGRHTGLYLGHAPESIKEKHYAAIPQKLFDEAIKWLGKQFGLD